MRVLSLLEKLAHTVHYRVQPVDFKSQPLSIQEAFSNHRSAQLKSLLGDVTNLADRDKVVCVTQ